MFVFVCRCSCLPAFVVASSSSGVDCCLWLFVGWCCSFFVVLFVLCVVGCWRVVRGCSLVAGCCLVIVVVLVLCLRLLCDECCLLVFVVMCRLSMFVGCLLFRGCALFVVGC